MAERNSQHEYLRESDEMNDRDVFKNNSCGFWLGTNYLLPKFKLVNPSGQHLILMNNTCLYPKCIKVIRDIFVCIFSFFFIINNNSNITITLGR